MKTHGNKYDTLLSLAIIAGAATVFGCDSMTELGVAGGVLYVGVVSLAYWGRDRKWIWTTALACIALTVIGYSLSPPGGEAWKVIFNRVLAIFAIGVTATLCDVAQRAQLHLRTSEQQLRSRVHRRTVELARSRAELDFAYRPSQDENTIPADKSAIVREPAEGSAGIETFDDFLDGWVQQARHLIGAHQGALSYFPHGNISEGQHAISLSDKYERFRSYDVLPSGEGIWRLVIEQKLSFCMTDEELQSHPAWKNFSELRDKRGLEHPPMRGWLAVPVLGRQQEFVGLLQLSDKQNGDFTADDLQRLTRLARLMAPSFSLQFAVEELQGKNAELTAAKDALEQSNIELQHFAYIASHDLQTPLRGIAGFAQFLQKDYHGRFDEKADDYIRRIVEGAKRMQELINDLLTYSRVESRAVPFAPTDLNGVFDEAVILLGTSIKDAAGAVTRDDLPTVVGDRTQLCQLFENLIGNAIKYRGDRRLQVHVSSELENGQCTIAVQDNGIGIPAKHHAKVFELFRRLHTAEKYPGTGIGLAVCRRIVHRHGGKIWLQSDPSEGCTFYFSIQRQGGAEA